MEPPRVKGSHYRDNSQEPVFDCQFSVFRRKSRHREMAGGKGPDMTTDYTPPGRLVAHNMVTTQFELDGFRVVRTLGVVRGIVVRSRSIFGTVGAALQTILGGTITPLTNLCEETWAEAVDLSLQHHSKLLGTSVSAAS